MKRKEQQKPQKLQLSSETLRTLTAGETKKVAGGETITGCDFRTHTGTHTKALV